MAVLQCLHPLPPFERLLVRLPMCVIPNKICHIIRKQDYRQLHL